MASWWSREGLPLLPPDPASVGDATRACDQALLISSTTAQVSLAAGRKMNNRLTYLAATLMYIALPAYSFTTWQPTLPLISAASTEAATMEVVVSKPRVSYSAFKAAQPQPQYQEHSVAFACQWRIDEAGKRGARKLGDSMGYTLRRMQREGIGAKLIPDLKPQDLVDHCRERIASGVMPATVNADATTLRSTLRDYVESNDLSHDWLAVFAKVKHKLRKEQLVGTSHLRDRLPTEDELVLLRAYFAKQNEHPNCITDMVLVLDSLVLTARRISELCRIERQHVNVETTTYMVYDLKNSKGKGYHGEAALIEGAWELFEQRLAAIPDADCEAVPVQFQDVQPALHAREEGIAERSPGSLQGACACTTTAPSAACACSIKATARSRSRRASRCTWTSRR
jgi:GNAT superfamily N-acetyltransferase